MKRAVIYLRVSTAAQADKAGDEEGFSIPAQREACFRKAADMDAEVVDQYLDRGESAKSADRPSLQLMLSRLQEQGDIDYVIVHKVDRLARSRQDDVGINLIIQQCGARLVSCSENIDDTPSGKLLHGIMATFAEYYSSNLATEAMKGMTQKAKKGGTPGMAPFGYSNATVMIQGKPVKTIVVDPERAPFVKFAFEAYSAGDMTIQHITEELRRQGCTTARRGTKVGGKPLHYSRVANLLSNRYYVGFVNFKGVEYQGQHEPLISMELFNKVQTRLAANRHARNKHSKHAHYLKGSVFCGECKGRLVLAQTTNRYGTVYWYFFCTGRQHGGTCSQPYFPVEQVETVVEQHYSRLEASISDEFVNEVNVKVTLGGLLAELRGQAEQQAAAQQKRLDRIAGQRESDLDLFHEGLVEKATIAKRKKKYDQEQADAEKLLRLSQTRFDEAETNLHKAIDLASSCHQAYREATPSLRRKFNQLLFENLWIRADQEPEATYTRPFAEMLDEQFINRLQSTHNDIRSGRLGTAPGNEEEPETDVSGSDRTRTYCRAGSGSNLDWVVPGTGLEPVRRLPSWGV